MKAHLQAARHEYSQGRVESALLLLERILQQSRQPDLDTVILYGQCLLISFQYDQLLSWLSENQALEANPRFQWLTACAWQRVGDLDKAAALLHKIRSVDAPWDVIRGASFELVKILDQQENYQLAWSIAEQEHKRMAKPYPIDLQEQGLRVAAEAVRASGPRLIRRASHPIALTAFVTGLPRSGTSLLEQMLDRHSRITGTGENILVGQMADAIAADGRGWPSGCQLVPTSVLDSWKSHYAEYVRLKQKVCLDHWSIDKTLFPIFQPMAIASVLPGARVIRITRNPLDTIVSIFLTNMHPSWAWTGNVEQILRMIHAERTYVPVIMDHLKVQQMEMSYESLVESPAEALAPVFQHLDLEPEEACLRPEKSSRVVTTRSNEQVRKPIHTKSIGRWQNYEPFLPKELFEAE